MAKSNPIFVRFNETGDLTGQKELYRIENFVD